MHNPIQAVIQFHSYRLGVHCYHCQFAEVGFFHGIAPVGLAAPANTSTMGNKKNSPNPTTIPSIASGKDHSFLFVSQHFHSHHWNHAVKALLVQGEKKHPRKILSSLWSYISMARCGLIWLSPSSHLSLHQNPQPPGFGSTAQRQAGCRCLQDSRPSFPIFLDPLLHLTSVVCLPSWERQM